MEKGGVQTLKMITGGVNNMGKRTFLGCRLLMVGEMGPLEEMAEVECGRGDLPCLHPGEPCPCKNEEDLLNEWTAAFDARMKRATAFLRNRGLEPEGDREARMERAENMAAEDLLPGVR